MSPETLYQQHIPHTRTLGSLALGTVGSLAGTRRHGGTVGSLAGTRRHGGTVGSLAERPGHGGFSRLWDAGRLVGLAIGSV
ncbi:hypothetical protein GCM10029976_048360 [Kribbella albertanoniae]